MELDIKPMYHQLQKTNLNYTVEEYLFQFQVDFYHLLSLLWSKSPRQSTDSYKIFLLSNCMRNLLSGAIKSNMIVDDLQYEIQDSYNKIKNTFNNVTDELIVLFNGETEINIDTIGQFAILCFISGIIIPELKWSDVLGSQKFENN